MSQLLDTYTWKPLKLLANSNLLRRDEHGKIIHLLPGQTYAQQPTKAMRDQRSMFDRIQRLTSRDSELSGLSEVAVLRGLETAISKGSFGDRQRPIAEIAGVIKAGAERIVA